MTQPDLFTPAEQAAVPGVSDADIATFSSLLVDRSNWVTRREACAALNWDERKLRSVAQALGGKVIRCQLGFKLTLACTRDDVPAMQQAANAAGSQGRIHLAYEHEILKHIHSLIG